MTVRFKCKSEYQKSYGVSRSRSVSPQRCAPLAGLRSDQMGVSREPGLQRRKKLSSGFLAQSCSSLLNPPNLQHPLSEPAPHSHRTAPPAASRSRSANRKEPNSPAPPKAHAESETPAGPRPAADPEAPVTPRPAADQGSQTGTRPAADPGTTGEPGSAEKNAKSHHSKPESQPQLSRPLTAAPEGQRPSANEHAVQWRAGLRSGGQRSEYNRQFSWKKPPPATSPLLTAEQVLHHSGRSVPPFKKNPVSMETEYQRSFQGLVPPTEPRLRKHLEHERVPLFYTHMINKKRREESERKHRPKHGAPTPPRHDATPPPPPPQVWRRQRMLTEYQSSFRSPLCRIQEEGGAADTDASQARSHVQAAAADSGPLVPVRRNLGAFQARELRQQASSYRRRAWGTNFSRDHLSQLLSEHNALWEPTDTTDSATDPSTPRMTLDLCRDPDSRSTSHVEALDLASRSSSSSRRSSVKVSGEIQHTNKNTPKKTRTPPSPPAERRSAWTAAEEEEEVEKEEEEEEERTDEEEGRLPTPRLKMLPVQRTHHDLTTPATGGAILVGKLKSSDESPWKHRSGSAVSMAAGAERADDAPLKQKEASPENNATRLPSSGPSPDRKLSNSPPSKPIKRKQTPSSPVAPPPLAPPPRCIQGTLRHPDFQHNGELGLRFREPPCSGGGCGSSEDDRLSVMSWRSAASCSMASAVLERAQKRRENFWGKR